MANRSKILDKSNASTVNINSENKEMEYFWSVVLSSEKRSVTWMVSSQDEEEDMHHTLFLKAAVLGGNAVSGEQNIIVLQSAGQDGEIQKGTIANLTRGTNPMTVLDLAIAGRIGGTFNLSEGSGPVTISGNHLLQLRDDDDDDIMDETQGDGDITIDEEGADENDDDEEEGSEGEEFKGKKGAKRKATPKATKHKQKAKMDVDDDDDDDEEEEEDEDDDDDDYEDVKTKKPKKGKVMVTKKGDKGKMKPEKETGKKVAKIVKK